MTSEWYKAFYNSENKIEEITNNQISDYILMAKKWISLGTVRNLKIISSPLSIQNNNGDVMHAIKNTDNGFKIWRSLFYWISSIQSKHGRNI